MEKLNTLILQYNRQFEEFGCIKWKVAKSKIAGKGIIATDQINCGDLIFIDHPLVIGPRSAPDQEPVCVGCYESENLQMCSKGCSLDVCSVQCENGPIHKFECEYLRKLTYNTNKSKSKITRVLTPLRCLMFDNIKKEIINHLHKINGPHQGLEVELLKRIVNSEIPVDDECFMQTCCSVLDANAYEVQLFHKKASVRGLYPMASIMNHSCVPNTRHDFTDNHEMLIKAVIDITAGTEITSTYAPLLMGTPARRHFLSKSKHFDCTCSRCKDSTESHTYLSAFRCRAVSCDSFILPIKPLDTYSKWSCQKCSSQLTSDKVAILQNVIAQQISKLNFTSVEEMTKFINFNRIVAPTHHSIVQFKFILLKIIGYVDGYKWSELSENLLHLKKSICEEILLITEKLALGQCQVSVVCMQELRHTNTEFDRRKKIPAD